MKNRERITALEQQVEKIAAHLGLSAPVQGVSAPVQDVSTPPLKDWVVPLEHSTLTREQVAERCVRAAELKGYKAEGVFGNIYSDRTHFHCHSDNGYTFHNHGTCFGSDTLTTLEAFEAYCGVKKPETYEAGFWWNNVCNLNLPDLTQLYLGVSSKKWQKSTRKYPKASKPHTLTRVNQHTVGRFYLTEGEDPNSYESYALCVAEGKFVQPTMSNGVVEVLVVDELFPNQVSLLEVTPVS